MKPRFIPVLFRMAIDPDTSQLEHAGFAFEVPGWPEFHAVAHTLEDGTWTATHWESGKNCMPYYRHCDTKEEVPAVLAKYLTDRGPALVRTAIALYK